MTWTCVVKYHLLNNLSDKQNLVLGFKNSPSSYNTISSKCCQTSLSWQTPVLSLLSFPGSHKDQISQLEKRARKFQNAKTFVLIKANLQRQEKRCHTGSDPVSPVG